MRVAWSTRTSVWFHFLVTSNPTLGQRHVPVLQEAPALPAAMSHSTDMTGSGFAVDMHLSETTGELDDSNPALPFQYGTLNSTFALARGMANFAVKFCAVFFECLGHGKL